MILLLAALLACPSELIRGASVIDGTGAKARVQDVRIAHGVITDIGKLEALKDECVTDGRGLVLAPGFIDSHSHHDRGIFTMRDALGAVSQGITTIVVGQDGGSRLPLAKFFAVFDTLPVAVNVASYVGHGTIRSQVMGAEFKRAATADEVTRMAELLRAEMRSGALGLSSGLEYDPGIYSSRDEVLALARVTGEFGGRYISHIRSEDRHEWEAIDEIINIGREAKIPVQISHMKLGMRALWGQSDSLLRVLDRVRKEGVNITADVYPWTMWSSTLTVLYPERNFSDRAETEFILRQVATPEDLFIGIYEAAPEYAGKTLKQIAEMRSSDPATTLMWLIAEAESKNAGESVVATGMDERDVVKLMSWPHASISSDGALNASHPRGFGSFTRALRYAREQKLVPLETMIYKMTGLPAKNLGLPASRGVIKRGAAADLVLFDAKTIAERSTLKDPHATSTGIRSVWVRRGRI